MARQHPGGPELDLSHGRRAKRTLGNCPFWLASIALYFATGRASTFYDELTGNYLSQALLDTVCDLRQRPQPPLGVHVLSVTNQTHASQLRYSATLSCIVLWVYGLRYVVGDSKAAGKHQFAIKTMCVVKGRIQFGWDPDINGPVNMDPVDRTACSAAIAAPRPLLTLRDCPSIPHAIAYPSPSQ
ncbi:uncharacterized protein PHACADRAFT_194757 [Phanerochaete carnosa HHB-10118-sp]|uniref:Uncharacterized protein n=1 Tax=Phanerochaete carnosa (strain HHB-10118-sp) TaxID=650164 RepID=K5W028_PHACS|nr:uncharacterized protein PHACADRAFT_194757 [Phanerochaete carnosa HHB-10118-sp]EKM57193.1 hypothetical protein PHACADRAFT_194757 [Phanerochaete carnosa HHB-10118-sp]